MNLETPTWVEIMTMSEKNTPIEKLLQEYTEECCDFTDMDWVIKVSRMYADRMPDSQVRCLLHTMAHHLKKSDEQQNVDIRKELVRKIHKYVNDDTGYLISLPDDTIKGILRLVQNSSLTAEEPWKVSHWMSHQRNKSMQKVFSFWRIVISIAWAKSLLWSTTTDKDERIHILSLDIIKRGNGIAVSLIILPISITIGWV